MDIYYSPAAQSVHPPLAHTQTHTHLHKHAHGGPTGLLTLSPKVRVSEQQRVLSHCDQLIGFNPARTGTHSAGLAVVETAMLPWWQGVMSQCLLEKRAVGMFILQDSCAHHSECRCCKINANCLIFPCIAALWRKPTAVSLGTLWDVAEALEMCGNTWARLKQPKHTAVVWTKRA